MLEPLTESARGREREQAAECGYLFFHGLVEPEVVLDLRSKALAFAEELGWLEEGSSPDDGIARRGIKLGDYDALDWIEFQRKLLPLPEFITLGEHPRVLEVLEELFGEAVMTRRGDICRVMSPGTPELTTVAHQDHFYVRGSERVWTAWIPLGDCPNELGGLAVLPGSHRRGLLPHFGDGSGRQGVEVEDAVWATADYQAGDVLFFNCLTVHRACPNTTADRIRISADYRYQPASEPI